MMRAGGLTRVPLRIDPQFELFRWECEPVPHGIPDSRWSSKFCFETVTVTCV